MPKHPTQPQSTRRVTFFNVMYELDQLNMRLLDEAEVDAAPLLEQTERETLQLIAKRALAMQANIKLLIEQLGQEG